MTDTHETMTYKPDRHHRRSIRLKDYDYSQTGAYFVTVCTKDRGCLFGEIADGLMCLSPLGKIVQACWDDLPRHYPHVESDAFVIMPNHIHGIIVLGAGSIARAGFKPAPTVTDKRHSLAEIMRAFKTFSSRRINERHNSPGTPVWQRNYYEHVIRNEDDLAEIREYITDNPLKWEVDGENPRNVRQKGLA
jgi:putative transposase